MNIVDMPIIRELIENNTAKLASVKFSESFDTYVTQLPWEISGNRLNWDNIQNSICIEWNEHSDEETKSFIGQTTIHDYEEIAVVFSAKQPALICSYDFIVDNLDTFFFNFHGAAYFVGYNKSLHSSTSKWDFLKVEIGGKVCGIKR